MANIALNFSTSNLGEMLAEAQQQTGADYQVGQFESICTLEQSFGRLSFHHIQLRNGLALLIKQWRLLEPLRVVLDTQNYAAFELSFCITGQFLGQFCASPATISASPGKNFSSFAQGDLTFTTEYTAYQPISVLTLKIAPDLLREMVPIPLLDSHLSNSIAIHTSKSEISGALGWTTPPMLTAIHQILQCPYQDEIKKLYLESKALELVALKLEQARQEGGDESPKTRLKPDDIDLIYRAKEILLHDIERPPSLMALARQVGINDFKLKLGFRQVFGTTVFGCLYQHRMEQARRLLETQNLRVAQVAQAVGYANPSQFSAAFKRKYGYSPRNYRVLHEAKPSP